MVSELDHRQVVANLTPEQRAELLQRSNLRGLAHLAGHAGAIIVLAGLILADVRYWPVLMLPLGVLLVFLFTALHECVHETPFETEWLGQLTGRVCGFLVLVPFGWFKWFHMAHHRHTHDPDHDPELAGRKPDSVLSYALYLSGLPVWKSNLETILNNSLGRFSYAYLPERQSKAVIREARLTVLALGLLFVLSFALQTTALVWIWIVPLLLGQPFLRAYLLAEHTRCPHVTNMLENSRTTFTWPIVRFIAWNMPYHAEHHAYPNVPFWQLPRFHGIIREHLRCTENGYVRFQRNLVSSFERN